MRNHSLRILFLIALIAPARGQDDARDPFALPDRKGLARGVVPAALPTLVRRGFIETAGGERLALLDIDSKRTYLVRKGDALTHGELTLRIAEIDKLGLRIEVGENGRTVVVR